MAKYSVAGPDGQMIEVKQEEYQRVVDEQVLKYASRTRIRYDNKIRDICYWSEDFGVSVLDLVAGMERQRTFEEVLCDLGKLEPCTCGADFIKAGLRIPSLWPAKHCDGALLRANPKCTRCNGNCFVRKEPKDATATQEPV